MSIAGQRRQQAQQRLQAWADFPMNRDPRPLVLLSPPVRDGPFPDGKAKLAFVRGLVEAAPGFPAELLQALRPHRQHAGPPVEPLVVTTATPGIAEFWTDRGRRELPAWTIYARGIPGPVCQVLDPGTSQHAWRPPGLEDHELYGDNTTAALGAGGRTLTLRFPGSPRGFADYPHAEVLEAGAAVAVLPAEVDTGPPPWVFRALPGEWREVTVILTQPLGARVLLDGDGMPVLVRRWTFRWHPRTPGNIITRHPDPQPAGDTPRLARLSVFALTLARRGHRTLTRAGKRRRAADAAPAPPPAPNVRSVSTIN